MSIVSFARTSFKLSGIDPSAHSNFLSISMLHVLERLNFVGRDTENVLIMQQTMQQYAHAHPRAHEGSHPPVFTLVRTTVEANGVQDRTVETDRERVPTERANVEGRGTMAKRGELCQGKCFSGRSRNRSYG